MGKSLTVDYGFTYVRYPLIGWRKIDSLADQYHALVLKGEHQTLTSPEKKEQKVLAHVIVSGVMAYITQIAIALKKGFVEVPTKNGPKHITLRHTKNTVDDLVQEGAVELLKHLPQYDPEKGNFSTFVYASVPFYLLKSYLDQPGLIKTSRLRTQKVIRIISKSEDKDEALRRIAETMDCGSFTANLLHLSVIGNYQEIFQRMNNHKKWGNSGHDTFEGRFLKDESERIEPDYISTIASLNQILYPSIDKLTPRQQQVIKMRFGIDYDRDYTLEEVGKELGLSRERVRQIEAKALKIIRQDFEHHFPELHDSSPTCSRYLYSDISNIAQLLSKNQDNTLNEEQRNILLRYCGLPPYNEPQSVRQISEELGFSKAQVYTMKKSAIKRLN